jgi:phage tail-like protein
MTPVSQRTYRFWLATHWGAGIRRNLELRGDRLVVPHQLAIEPVAGAGRAENRALPAIDACGRLTWLRPGSRTLVRRPLEGTRGVIELGTLDWSAPPRRLLAGRTLVWVVSGEGLDRYAAATLQRLSPVEAPAGRRISDAAGDGGDGLWLTEVDSSGGWQLRHVDCWGRSCRPPIAVPGSGDGELAITATTDGRCLVVADPDESSTAHVIDAAAGEILRSITFDRVHLGRPTLLTAAPGQRIHLLTVLADARADGGAHALYQVLNLDGDVEDHQELQVPRCLGRPTAMVGGPTGLVVACSHGLADIAPRQAMTGERLSTFITPAMVSPLGPRSGWNRAEIDVVLPAGTAVDVTWASTDDPWLISEVGRLFVGPATADLVERLAELLPWRDEETVTYAAGDGAGAETLAALLDAAVETTLWLRIQLHTPPGRTPPELVGLRVRYPDTSYLDDLPAIYREQTSAARELRRILAPYEVLFDGLDQALDSLPERIAPATAHDDWTDYLLSWLGFPPLGDLPAALRRALLQHAPVLLEGRGTREGLRLLLDLVTEGRSRVTDSAEEPPGWFLGPGDVPSVGATPARLGIDTISLAQRPEPSRPGTMIVGGTPLGRGCPDPELVLAQRASIVTVTLELDRERQEDLGPVIERLLHVFVPVHCRVRLIYTAADAADRSRQLDVDFRLGSDDPASGSAPVQRPYDGLLHSDAHWRLGATTWLGGWPLPERAGSAAVLDMGAALGSGQRLH